MPKDLWQLGLEALCEEIGGSTHWLDRDRAYRMAQGLHAVGERPPLAAVRACIRDLWGNTWRQSGDMVWEAWQGVYRKPFRLLRGARWEPGTLYQVDVIIERHGLKPVTEDRLAVAAEDALRSTLQAARAGTPDEYSSARRALAVALERVDELRALRLGAQGEGDRPPRRPPWW